MGVRAPADPATCAGVELAAGLANNVEESEALDPPPGPHELRIRARRLALAGAGLLVALLALRAGSAGIERRLEARFLREAASVGARARLESVRLAVWPPLRVTGVEIDKPGLVRARVSEVTARPRLGGRSGWRPVLRIASGRGSVALPAGLELDLAPSQWDWDGRSTVELVGSGDGSSLRGRYEPGGNRLEVRASRLEPERIGEARLDGIPIRPGPLDGELLWEKTSDKSQALRVRGRAAAVDLALRASLEGARGGERLAAELEIDRLDFTRLFAALDMAPPLDAADLGVLRALVRADGPLRDPAALEVEQRLDYRPPARLPAALLRLRGEFAHDVAAPGGGRLRIEVSPASSGFIARADVPPLFVRALLLAEDSAFFSHGGLELRELPKALAANWEEGGAVRGASTITQQLAKNLFLTRERSVRRKLQELALAFLIEAALGKDRILEIYLNVIEWGPGLHGLRPAARHYFGKEPELLGVKEMAFLVVMIPGPVKYQRSFREGALTAGLEPLVANLLAKLRSVDAIGEEEYQAALAETLVFRRPLDDLPAPAEEPEDVPSPDTR
jgi:hypothetical protein